MQNVSSISFNNFSIDVENCLQNMAFFIAQQKFSNAVQLLKTHLFSVFFCTLALR